MTTQYSLNLNLVSAPVRSEVLNLFATAGPPGYWDRGIGRLVRYYGRPPGELEPSQQIADHLSTVVLFANQEPGTRWQTATVREFLAEVWRKHNFPGEPDAQLARKASWQRGSFYRRTSARRYPGLVELYPTRFLHRYHVDQHSGVLARHLRALETMEV